MDIGHQVEVPEQTLAEKDSKDKDYLIVCDPCRSERCVDVVEIQGRVPPHLSSPEYKKLFPILLFGRALPVRCVVF